MVANGSDPIRTIPVDGGRIACRRRGSGRPLLVLNGLAATSADWDPSFIERLASANELILLDNRGIGASTDSGAPFDIDQLADDTARVTEALEFDRVNVLGWSLGGFIAQALALQHPARVNKLVLLSTDAGGADAQLASPAVRSQLIDTSGTPREQARRLLSLLFPAFSLTPSCLFASQLSGVSVVVEAETEVGQLYLRPVWRHCGSRTGAALS
jgi:pimeloyl-ACP methyl ester carboxylesterase